MPLTTILFFESRLRFGWRVLLLLGLWVGLVAGLYTIVGRADLLIVYALLVLVTWFVLKFIDDRSILTLGLRVDHQAVKYSIIALTIGVCMLTLVWGAMVITESIHVEASSYGIPNLLYATGIFFAAAFGEEFLFRGYIFQHFIEATRAEIAIVVCSLFFALIHALNPGVTLVALTNVFLAGVWLSLGFLVWRSLWAVTAMHFGWNLTQGSIVGIAVSGNNFPSILRSEINPQTSEFLTGGAFGAEGNIFTTAVLLIAIIFLYRKWQTQQS